MTSIKFIPSKNDRLKLNLNGYIFTKERQRNNNVYWKCEQWKSKKCKGRAKTIKFNGAHKLTLKSEHNHSPITFKDYGIKVKKTKDIKNTELDASENLIE